MSTTPCRGLHVDNADGIITCRLIYGWLVDARFHGPLGGDVWEQHLEWQWYSKQLAQPSYKDHSDTVFEISMSDASSDNMTVDETQGTISDDRTKESGR